MIAYIYHNGTDWKKKTAVELFEIAKLANYYDVTGLMTKVNVVISQVPVTLSNVVELAITADKFSMMSEPLISKFLKDRCVSFLFNILHIQVLDFSGLHSTPEDASTTLRLHTMLLEKPLPLI